MVMTICHASDERSQAVRSRTNERDKRERERAATHDPTSCAFERTEEADGNKRIAAVERVLANNARLVDKVEVVVVERHGVRCLRAAYESVNGWVSRDLTVLDVHSAFEAGKDWPRCEDWGQPLKHENLLGSVALLKAHKCPLKMIEEGETIGMMLFAQSLERRS